MKRFSGQWFREKKVAAGIYYTMGVRRVRRSWRQRANARAVQRPRQSLHVQIDSPVGLFAHLSWCLKIVDYCRRRKLIPFLTCTSAQYGEGGQDWFNMLFQQPLAESLTQNERRRVDLRLHEFEELPFYADSELTLTIEEAARLQQTYFPVNASVAQHVEAFATEHFIPGATLGCHFRGTDKDIEAARVAFDQMLAALHRSLHRLPHPSAIFVATDEAAFIKRIRAEFPGTKIICADHARSTDGRALHASNELNGLVRGQEALADALLLSRSDLLVKSPSALSAWSKVFNPALQVTLIGRPYDRALFFPESALLEAQGAPR